MRTNYEQPPRELSNSKGVHSFRCRGQAGDNEITDAYGRCLSCLKLKAGEWASKVKG